MSVVVQRPGLLTTVQDGGRWGYQHFGVPVAGAMDLPSHRSANMLVGNTPSAAALEVTLQGPELMFEQITLFAVTGAEFDVRLDGIVVSPNTSTLGRPGQVLSFGEREKGARGYVAVAGGFDVPPVLGSRSTHVASRMGGVTGRPLRSGDRLPVGDTEGRTLREGVHRAPAISLPTDGARVRVIAGPHAKMFSAEQLEAFGRTRYHVTPLSDRMGYRLEGPRVEPEVDSRLISSAVPIGSVQVPPGALPIVLMADHQTIGGYPRIATVIGADMSRVGQLMPSNWIEFQTCSETEAIQALIALERLLMSE